MAAIVLLVATFALSFGCTSPTRPYGQSTGGSGAQGSGGGGGSGGGHSADGATCGGGAECKSGFCVDGVCCNSVCDNPCHACAAKLTGAADGDCSPVLGGSDPHADCPDDGAASCGRTGACGDKGSCAFYASGTECAAQTCSGSTKTLARTCDGAGTCADNGTTSCAPKMCAGNVCSGDCAGDASCAMGKYCDLGSGQCLDKLADGTTCQAAKANECQSGFCAYGVCCHQACTGKCEACTHVLTGSPDGTCAPAPAGTDPNGDCSDQGVASCGTDGFCDGAGACRKYASGAQCVAGSCTGATATNPSTCDGQGTCVNNGTASCAPFTCAGAVCASNCTSDPQCGTGKWCNGGSCVTKSVNGSTCGGGNQCQTGFCVDGVCCDSACAGLCQACSVARKGSGSNGACGAIVAGTDPDSECTDQGAMTCGTNGFCDGAGACQDYVSGTACGATTCSGHLQTNGGTCNGSGTCNAGGSTDCSPYLCGATACKSTCSSAGDCISGYTCAGGACVLQKGLGVPCGAGPECQTGNCVDGVCCNGACSSLCQACTSAKKGGSGADGLCGFVPSGSDPDAECADQGAASCGTDGTCNGAGACRLYGSGTVCGAGTCAGGMSTTSSTCNGGGSCLPGMAMSCGAYTCNGAACRTSCTLGPDCASGYICSGSMCVTPLPQGSPCTTGSQCANGICAQGFCCNTTCTGVCKSCDGSQTDNGVDGTCDNISCPLKGGCGGNLHCQNGSCTSNVCL